MLPILVSLQPFLHGLKEETRFDYGQLQTPVSLLDMHQTIILYIRTDLTVHSNVVLFPIPRLDLDLFIGCNH